jgi:hypothetical protein
VAAGAPLAPGERVLLAARDAGGAPVVATERALYHQHGSPGDGWRRIGWEQVGRVEWDAGQSALTLTGPLPAGPSRTVLRLSGSTALVDVARERARASTLTTARVRLDARREAVVSARRQPGSDQLTWAVRFGPGVDPDDPRTMAQLDAAIAELRADLGL